MFYAYLKQAFFLHIMTDHIFREAERFLHTIDMLEASLKKAN